MLNIKPSMVSNLSTLELPVVAEPFLTEDTPKPCISYSVENDVQYLTGDTLGYSNIYFTVKVWGTRISDIEENAVKLDELMRSLGFTRTGTIDLWFDNVGNKTMRYRALGLELFE